MARPKIAVFSGPTSTIANSPSLVTSNKGRNSGDRTLPGRFDHLVAQSLYEPVTVRIKKFSGHPMEQDGREVYWDNGQEYYEVELHPEDGAYLLPYMARRNDGSGPGVPFEAGDLTDPSIVYGGRQTFYPDASRVFADIDRGISGRDEHGEVNSLDRKAEFEFIRALPPAGYTQQGEQPGEDYFAYQPFPMSRRPRYSDLARVTNTVARTMAQTGLAGAIWLEGSPTVEETAYWLNLLIDTQLPITTCASQRTHGQLANDGDRNIVDAVDVILSGETAGMGVVGVQDERIYAAREFKKADDRPGNYKATGGHGGILGTAGPPVTIWYRPNYKHTAASDVNLTRLPADVIFTDTIGDSSPVSVRVKDSGGGLLATAIPRVNIVKHASYMGEDDSTNPDQEVDILARIAKALSDQSNPGEKSPKLHGLVLEGTSPYGLGSTSQMAALAIAVYSGLPVVRVGRSDPGGRVPGFMHDLSIAGSNLDANKARLLLMASMLKLGRFPKAKDPRNPTSKEKDALLAKIAEFQEIFESH
jgi:L-asparaginase/Glu-tRNA(Gln) amidotransferase subunit D